MTPPLTVEKESQSQFLSIIHQELREIVGQIRRLEGEVIEIRQEMKSIKKSQDAQRPALDSLQHVVSAGLVMRWIFIGSIGIMSTIAVGITAWDSIKNYFK